MVAPSAWQGARKAAWTPTSGQANGSSESPRSQKMSAVSLFCHLRVALEGDKTKKLQCSSPNCKLTKTRNRILSFFVKNSASWASLVAQWLRICLPMQGTRVRARVWEDPTRRGATKPVRHNYWACASGACAPNKRGRDSERPAHGDEEWPPLAATRESPRTETRTQHSHK